MKLWSYGHGHYQSDDSLQYYSTTPISWFEFLSYFVPLFLTPPNPGVASGACLDIIIIIFISSFLLLFVFSHHHISLSFPPSFLLFFCFTSSTFLVYLLKLNSSSALFWPCVNSLRLLRSHDHYNDLYPPPPPYPPSLLPYFFLCSLIKGQHPNKSGSISGCFQSSRQTSLRLLDHDVP